MQSPEITHATIRSGDQSLHAMHCAADRPVATLVLLHGYGEHAMRYAEAMRRWAARGLDVRALDFRGHGVSTGRRGYVQRWEAYLDDVRALLDRPEPAGSAPPLFLVGHSHGGLVALAGVLRGYFDPRGLILCAPYLRACHPVSSLKRLAARLLNPILPAVRIGTGLPGQWMTRDQERLEEARRDTLLLRSATPRWFLGMRAAQRYVTEHAGDIRLPLLALHGTADQVADRGATERLVAAAASTDKTIKLYPDARHELLREINRLEVLDDIPRWILARARQRDRK